MKRGMLLVCFIAILIVNVSFVVAYENETGKVNDAYECLDKLVHGNCASLTLNERIFSVLALQTCGPEILTNSNNQECWPSSGCNLKTTAQATLALSELGIDTNKSESWLRSQNKTATGLTWYLEIDSEKATTCSIVYDSNIDSVDFGADRRITGSTLSSCLSVNSEGYWLTIDNDCYEKEFKISCDQDFLTTLIFTKEGSSTIHVSQKIDSSGAGGETTERVNSNCLSLSGSCNYEGTLWAAAILDSLGHDVQEFLPYLIVMADENKDVLPSALLYFLTEYSDFKVQLLSEQTPATGSVGWWDESGNKFHDTALALLPFQGNTLDEKNKAKEWLLGGIQGSDGCWNNLENTAFILYSLWPQTESFCGDGKIDTGEQCDGTNLGGLVNCSEYNGGYDTGTLSCTSCSLDLSQCSGEAGICGNGILEAGEDCDGTNFSVIKDCSDLPFGGTGSLSCLEDTCLFNVSNCVGGDDDDCLTDGYYCRSRASCIQGGGNVLNLYCPGMSTCCDASPLSSDCVSDLGGVVCDSDQTCDGGSFDGNADYTYGERCCVGGTCKDAEITAAVCKGECRTDGCLDGELKGTGTCEYSGDTCCMEGESGGSLWWLWLLIILIILIIVAIVFRERLRPYWIRTKEKFSKKKKPMAGGPGRRPGMAPMMRRPPMQGRRPMQRRILPPNQRPLGAPKRPMPGAAKPKKEIDDVLKKLKEMGK